MPGVIPPLAWRRHRTQEIHSGRNLRYAYIRDVRQAGAPVLVQRHLCSRVCERPVPTPPSDPFEQLAAECGLRVSMERVTLAPRDLAAPPDEAEQCYLVTVTAPEGGTAARLAFVRSLQNPEPPGVRDALWWLASDAWAIEQSGGAVARWATMQRLTSVESVAEREFAHYRAQTRSLAQALGADVYQRLLAAYEVSVRRAGSVVGPVVEPRDRQQHQL